MDIIESVLDGIKTIAQMVNSEATIFPVMAIQSKSAEPREWKALIKANHEEILELREQINWHHREAKRLSTMP